MPEVAVSYAAKSTEDRRGSIPDQLADGRALAASLSLSVVAEFQDENASAYHGDRGPGLAQAIAECERLRSEGIAVSLVVQHSDRLARGDVVNAKHLVEYAVWAIRTGVKIRSVQDQEMFADGEYGLLMSAVGGIRNNQDSARKAKAVSDGLRRRARDTGRIAGGPRPYGYRWRAWLDERGDRQSELVVVSSEVPVVIRMFEEAAAGRSQLAISRALNGDGLTSATGIRWTQSSVRRVLTNPLYVGSVRHDGTIYPGAHKAIVGEDLFNAAAAIREMEASKRTTKNAAGNLRGAPKGTNRGGGRKPAGNHVFTRGLLRCGQCGSALVPRTNPRSRGPAAEIYYCHGRRAHGADFCPQLPVDRKAIDDAILRDVSARFLDLEETRPRLEAKRASDEALAAQALEQAERDLARAEAALTRLVRAFQDGYVEASDYAQQRVDLLAERDAAHAAVNQVDERHRLIDPDADDEVLKRLADLRAQVLGKLEDAPDLDAFRTLMSWSLPDSWTLLQVLEHQQVRQVQQGQ